jgi:hypothetical protein
MSSNGIFLRTGYEELIENEIEKIFFQFGSLVSLLHDKHLSVTVVFSEMLDNKDYMDIFTEMSSADKYELIRFIIHKYPILHKSKKIKRNDYKI